MHMITLTTITPCVLSSHINVYHSSAGHAMSVDICSSSSSKQPTPKSREDNSSSSSSSSPPSSKPRHDPSLSGALAPTTNIDLESPSRRPARPGWSSTDSGRVSQGSAHQMTTSSSATNPSNTIQNEVVSSGSVVVGGGFSSTAATSSKLERTSRSSEDSPMVVLQHPTTVTSH